VARKRKKTELRPGELNLTAMIDVAFQMLSFFIVTSHPVDVLANLDVFRPSAEAATAESRAKPPPKMIRIQIFPDGFTVNDRPIDLQDMDRILTKLAALDTTQTILIMCASQSPHGKLIDVLDLCAKAGLVNLSVVSAM
jgi:biopolymer transport protein ExbD